jgi:hypothetical protein
MNQRLSSALGGLAGAFVLTALNEGSKRIDKDAPRLDLLAMNAVARLVKGKGIQSLTGAGKMLPASLAGDLITNSLYFGMASAGDKRKTLLRGTLLGLGAGLGAITLAKPLGLDARVVSATPKTKVLTVAWYVIGGLAAAAAINMLTTENRHEI